jgi:hypothetical protein
MRLRAPGNATTCPWCAHSLISSAEMEVTFPVDGTDLHRRKSSNPGAENMTTKLIVSVPVFFNLIQVLAGTNTSPVEHGDRALLVIRSYSSNSRKQANTKI